MLKKKKGYQREKNGYISMEANSASILDGKPTFSVGLCKRKLVFVFKGQA